MSEHLSEGRDYLLERLRDSSWGRQQYLFDKIERAGGIATFVQSLQPAKLVEAFKPVAPHLVCCDEGTAPLGDFRSPGQLILIKDPAVVDGIMKDMIACGLQAVKSHEDCGAAAVAFDKLSDTEKVKYGNNSDEYGKAKTRELAAKYGLQYGHIPGGEMQRPTGERGYHDARVIYVADVQLGDVRKAGLPNGFVVDWSDIGPDISVVDVELLAGIATGHHGMGKDRFKPQPGQQLLVVPIVTQRPGGQMVLDQIARFLKPLESKSGGMIKVEGFMAPEVRSFTNLRSTFLTGGDIE